MLWVVGGDGACNRRLDDNTDDRPTERSDPVDQQMFMDWRRTTAERPDAGRQRVQVESRVIHRYRHRHNVGLAQP